MKFSGTSFQVSREPREESMSPGTRFNMNTLRRKQSKPMLEKEFKEWTDDNVDAPEPKVPKRRATFAQRLEEEHNEAAPRPPPGKRHTMQDFFRSTSANLKATGAILRNSSTKIQNRMPVRHKSRVAKPQPASKRNSRQMRSLDLDEDVLDKLSGPRIKQGSGKIQSDSFFVNQRVRASSRNGLPHVSPSSGLSKAESDKKPLSQQEVEQMFIGAPYFNVEKLSDGRCKPQVIFRGGDVEESRRYGRDYRDLGHTSFGACTLGLHTTRETAGMLPSRALGSKTEKETMLEVPSMLSANGLDHGTIGFEHYLQLPVADSTVLPDEPIFEKRKLLYTDPEQLGLRDFELKVIIDRLTQLADIASTRKSNDSQSSKSAWSDGKIAEMGEQLFGRILDPELGTTSAGTGSVTLRTQLAALQKVLGMTGLWHDFSQVEWRIRVGQLLWASQEETPDLEEQHQPSARDFLLLQIMLAGELMVRLDAMKDLTNIVSFPPLVSAVDREAVRAADTRKLQWDVLLARVFLDNMSISAKVVDTESKTGMGNRSSLFSAITFLTANETSEEPAESSVMPVLLPKNEERQWAGLMHFAETLQWPHVEDMRAELEAKLAKSTDAAEIANTETQQLILGASRPVSGISLYATPLSSPRSPDYTPGTNRRSHFGGLMNNQQSRRRPGISRMTTADSVQLLPASPLSSYREGANDQSQNVSDFEVGSWLSRSWLTGLVLPGEPASHFLISTMLENSPEAIEVLGDFANLYGGFVYRSRIVFSKSSVVGQVLGASKGARDCMGWISVPDMLTAQVEEGWVDLDVKEAPATAAARIKDVESVAKASDPVHGSSVTSMQAADFVTPFDGPVVMGNEVKCHGLSFVPEQSSLELAKANDAESIEGTSVAYLTFSSPINPKLDKLEVPLAYDVHFVASYPCHPQSLQQARRSSSKGQPRKSSNAVSPDTDQPAPNLPSAPKRADQSEARDSSSDAKDSKFPDDSVRASAATMSIADIEKDLPPPPAHPLHKEYHYSVIPVATLLSTPSQARPHALSSPEERVVQQATDNSSDSAEGVIVVDCRGTEDLELLARAWCAKVGESALIGRSVVTCLACCVREARALGVGVVIRI